MSRPGPIACCCLALLATPGAFADATPRWVAKACAPEALQDVHRVRHLPQGVQRLLGAGGAVGRMADPGEDYRDTCLQLYEGQPGLRLVSAAVGERCVVVRYEGAGAGGRYTRVDRYIRAQEDWAIDPWWRPGARVAVVAKPAAPR